jgi:hypothetical protein
MTIDIKKPDLPGFKTIFCFLLMLILLGSCKQKKDDHKLKSERKEVIPKQGKSTAIKPDTILNSSIGYVEGRRFVMVCNSGDHLFLLDNKGDTLYQDSVYSPHQKFVDFNGDGYKDILIEYMTNVPGIEDLLLYDRAENTYKKVIDLQNFPSAERIGNSNYYYSYHRSGCADMDWDSDLFYIENYKTVKIGNISGKECGHTGVKDGIYINKMQGEKQTEIAKLPISIIKRYKDYKWGFIKQYWHKNYKRFL